jgi:hypothetical protein
LSKIGLNKNVIIALLTVLILQVLFTVTLLSALRAPVPYNMPFGVTGSSPNVDAVQSELSLDIITYASEAEATTAAEAGEIYGAYIPSESGDTLIVVPAKSFFGEIYVRGAFKEAAKTSNQSYTVKPIAPLPAADRMGTVAGLLMLPALMGGYLVTSMLFKATATATVARRITMLAVFSVVAALLIDIIAGPIIGAFSTSYFWVLWPSLALVVAAIAFPAAAIQGILGKMGSLVVALLFILIGGPSAGGVGVSLLPSYWQTIGIFLPPRYAVELYRNILYFGGSNTLLPITVLTLYVLVGLAGMIIIERRKTAVAVDAPKTPPAQIALSLGIATLMTCLFSLNYTSAGHSPMALNMPIGVVGTSDLVTAVQNQMSVDVIEYASESDAKNAIDHAEIYGALISGDTTNTLLVAPSLSDIAPLDLALQFETASEQVGQPVTIQSYVPVPLAPGDPFALVASMLIVPLLVGGYMSVTLVVGASGRASMRGRVLVLAIFAIVSGLVMDIVGVVLFKGLPMQAFWLLWPIMSLTIVVVALVAGVLRRLLGSLGTAITVIALIQFGNPSSGGANGAAYLPSFWNTLGPFLPPRSALDLIRNVAYFESNSITQPLMILLAYLVVFGVILSLLDLFRSPEQAPVTQAEEAVAMVVVPPV